MVLPHPIDARRRSCRFRYRHQPLPDRSPPLQQRPIVASRCTALDTILDRVRSARPICCQPCLERNPTVSRATVASRRSPCVRVMTLLSVRAGQSFGRDSEPQRKSTFQHACRAATMLRGARSSLTHRKELRHAGRLWDERARRSSCTPLTAPPSPSHTRALLQWLGDDR